MQSRDKTYHSGAIKLAAVHDYLDDNLSLEHVLIKYTIPSREVLHEWCSRYARGGAGALYLENEEIHPSDTKSRILEHTKQFIARSGVKLLTLDSVAQELHISKRTIYKHFSNKKDLVEEVCHSYVENDRRVLDRAFNDQVDHFDRLQSLFYIYNIAYLKKSRAEELAKEYPDAWKIIMSIGEIRKDYVHRAYEAGVADGMFVERYARVPFSPVGLTARDTAELLALIMNSVMEHALQTLMSDLNFDINTALMYTSDIVMRSFLTEQGLVHYYRKREAAFTAESMGETSDLVTQTRVHWR